MLACLCAAAVAGCGSSSGHGSAHSGSSPAALMLQREDFVAVSRGLQSAEASMAREMAAARIAWPLVAGGLTASIPQATRGAVSTASRNARAIVVPGLLRVGKARELTGPAAGIAGLFGPFVRLTERGWTLTGTAIDEIAGGTPTSARFARENVALYIDAVYDGHFDASLIGKGLLAGYLKLGGSEAFGAKLTAAEVDALARAYSPQAERLHPHPGVKLGS